MYRKLFPVAAFFLLGLTSPCPGQSTEPVSSEASTLNSRNAVVDEEASSDTNRLASESSPYLLQHAHNPVDWYPWGEEALAAAQAENKPIFLSVGYSACHWCHVMERESFMDDEIAAVLNESFVCIKVDREERPDIDQIYMTAVQALTGGGGWPMSVFLTPDGKPFWGGTYFPARDSDRPGIAGFLTIATQIARLWEEDRQQVTEAADALTGAIREHMAANANAPSEAQIDAALSAVTLKETQAALADSFDPEHGGFGYSEAQPMQPKFPEPANLFFLLYRARQRDLEEAERQRAEEMLTKTLDGMISGGIYDHLGDGFHRYSVDRFWQIPHFEKMLYDNGQLASVYARAYELTGEEEYRSIAEGICQWALREMRADGGAFYAALDADSEGEEGKYYRWSREALEEAAVSMPDYPLLADVYGFKGKPNFEEEYFVPQPGTPLRAKAKKHQLTFVELDKQLQPMRVKLRKRRDERVRPRTDTKILTAWNGLMIAGLADAGRILERPEYVAAAADTATFLLANLRGTDGRLLRSFAAGEAKLNGYLDDYAFLVRGLLALHEADPEGDWFGHASALTDEQIARFWDGENGGFYFTAADHEQLIVRAKDPIDGAVPAGNSVATNNLVTLARLSAEGDRYHTYAEKTLRANVPLLNQNPVAVPLLVQALGRYLEPVR